SLTLDVKPELHHVAVDHHVVLTLHAHLARGLGRGHRARGVELGERHDLGLDEALLEVGVDHASGLGGGVALADGPGPRLLGPGADDPGSVWPSDSTTSIASSSSSSWGSASTLASRNTASAGATAALSSALRSSLVSTASSALNTYRNGLAVIRCRSRISPRSISSWAWNSVRPSSRTACALRISSRTGTSDLSLRESFSIRGTAFSMVSRSARINSVAITSMSAIGSTLPSTWMTSGSSNTRTT